MEQLSLEMLIFLIVAGFVAAFVDSVVGGGGLISLPALLFVGLPPTVALGTNKLASTFSSMTSSLTFLLSGKINIKLVSILFPLSIVGSALGSYTITLIPSSFLKPLVVVMLILVMVYSLIKKNWGRQSTYKGFIPKTAVFAVIFAFAIGYYDGFFGPGTGSFLIFCMLLIGFDYVSAAGNAKVLNFGSNIASLLTFALLDSVNFSYGIPMGIAMVAGALIGSKLAIRKGTSFVKPLFIIITTLLIGKLLWDLITNSL